MDFQYTLLFLLAAFSASEATVEVVNGRIKITTVTTAGCGDTVNFITQQLVPAYNSYGAFIDLEFVPWGRTVRNADNSLTCQFGVQDCWANRLHRCALDLLSGNQPAQLFYMNCEFTAPYPSLLSQSYLCAQAAGLNIAAVDYCMASSRGDVLAAAAEVAARQPMAEINFVPAIVFNDNIDIENHNLARTSLSSMICFALAEVQGTGVLSCGVRNKRLRG